MEIGILKTCKKYLGKTKWRLNGKKGKEQTWKTKMKKKENSKSGLNLKIDKVANIEKLLINWGVA